MSSTWGEAAVAVLGGGVVVKLYETWRAGRGDVRAELQARVVHLEGLVDRLYRDLGDLRAQSAACEARCQALMDALEKLS